MRVSVCLAVEIPDRAVSVKGIEEAVAKAAQCFPSEAWTAVVREVERRAQESYPPGALQVQGTETRSLWTSFGPVTFSRRRYRSEAEPKSFLLFDSRVGLKRWRRSTEAAEGLMAEMAAEMPYAMAARSLERLWGEAPSPMRIWHAVQREGAARQTALARVRDTIFEEMELPGWERAAPEFLAVEADSTFLPAWRDRTKQSEVFVGVSYTGKQEQGKRRRLEGREICASLRGVHGFGRDLFVSAQMAHNVAGVERGLFLSDGATCLHRIQEKHFPCLVRQADWAHVKRKTREAYGRERQERASELLQLLAAGKHEAVCAAIRGDARRWRGRGELLKELAGYLEGLGEDLYGAWRLRADGAELPPHMTGSGGIERQIGVLVTQRMKRRGMSWSRRGAANLLAVRQDLLNRLNAS